MKIDLKEVKKQANGQWYFILTAHGLNREYLTKRNGPCPFCGGKDRWRWDDKDGNGSGYCHQCDARGDGFKILGKLLNLTSHQDFPKLLQAISETLGCVDRSNLNKNEIYASSKNKNLEAVKRIWIESKTILDSTVAALYLTSRGLAIPDKIESFRWHPRVSFYHSKKYVGCFPALISKISDLNNNITGIHRIYLNEEGQKLTLGEPKKILGSVAGGAIRFDEPKTLLNIAEGVETSLAVREVTKEPTWSAISASNLPNVRIPKHVSTVVIWADLDANQVGEIAAATLARRLCLEGKTVFVKVPQPIPLSENKKSDRLDIYNHLKNNGELYGI